jgi:hypothetical protein
MENLPIDGPAAEIGSFLTSIEHNLSISWTSRKIGRFLMRGRRPGDDPTL